MHKHLTSLMGAVALHITAMIVIIYDARNGVKKAAKRRKIKQSVRKYVNKMTNNE